VVRIYTKTGDAGETSLFGGERVKKDHDRLDAYGTLDELNAFLGWYLSRTKHDDLASLVRGIQPVLFDIGARLATPAAAAKARASLPVVPADSVTALEAAVDGLDAELEPLTAFILPGGAEASALLHVARAVCRRAERRIIRATASDPLDPPALAYLNRLSDLLFVMARVENRRAGGAETTWPAG
jgi:cob(I)alamin adenosyltransferase